MANKAISTLAVGSSVYLNVGGVRKEFLVVHQGKPSSLYDSSCDGTWLLMKDCYTSRVWSDYSSNNYKIASINPYLNGPFLGLFDADIQGIIKQVKIPYVNGTGGAAVASGASGLSCKVFLLGGCEVGLSSIGNVPSDGVKLDYFDSTISTDTKRVANLNGSPMGWALRSADSNTSNTIWFITVRGAPNNYQSYANGSFGIRPALILPSTTLVDDRGNVVTVDLTAHKTLINGTAYEVKGGKCMVNGTVYSIKKGRTLIGGTRYDIKFSDGLTWVINEKPDIPYSQVSWNADFICEAISSTQECYVITMGYYPSAGLYAIGYGQRAIGSTDVYYSTKGWLNNAYRTITFSEPPTGDLLTWLQANAVQQ